MAYSKYPDWNGCRRLMEQIEMHALMKYESDAPGLNGCIDGVKQSLEGWLDRVKALPADETIAQFEPDSLEAIRRLRPAGPRRMWGVFDAARYEDRIQGALLCRFAGCTLGALAEGWPVERMEKWAQEIGDPFPPTDYWTKTPEPYTVRYNRSRFEEYTRDKMDGVPADDDIAYTLLGLMMLEKYGLDFTTDDSAHMWNEYLHWVFVDMEIPLIKWRNGIPALHMADGNPYGQFICADIRCDPFGYVLPGRPEDAAALAYKDSYASHRRNGLYGGMFFAAAISAAFAVEHPIEAIKAGLAEIPYDSELARAVRWALATDASDYKEARKLVDERYTGMPMPHTLNNACLTVFGLKIGGRDVNAVLSQTVAMGIDNDCSAATAGSIVGAAVGRQNVPEHWYKPFNNKIHTYIKGYPCFSIDDVANRYANIAKNAF